MRKELTQLYVLALWMLCGLAVYTLVHPFFRQFPTLRGLCDNFWSGTLIIGAIAAIIVEPAGRRLGFHWGIPGDEE